MGLTWYSVEREELFGADPMGCPVIGETGISYGDGSKIVADVQSCLSDLLDEQADALLHHWGYRR